MKAIRIFVSGLFFFLFGMNSWMVQMHAQELYDAFYSQASQDEFVHALLCELLGKQDIGYYLEIGASDPIVTNNTYFFEKNYGWKGISIDIAERYAAIWNLARENSLLINDATQVDYHAILLPFPRIIDYLSLDVDDQYDLVLQRIPFENYIFKVITIEHDFYRFGDVYRKREREILSSLGYYLLCPDIKHGELIFEDWWIHPSTFPDKMFSTLTSLDLKEKQHDQIIRILKSIKDPIEP
jgi:hypothetical protein